MSTTNPCRSQALVIHALEDDPDHLLARQLPQSRRGPPQRQDDGRAAERHHEPPALHPERRRRAVALFVDFGDDRDGERDRRPLALED
eukprot:CAMPEP_0198668076 /NCGR_PEP_ID=MMETSP1467-20131203/71157_1 /TAXON_ID=1462469 /ORGANISM="unid. sp., Strain CCMP2135" /LENGTH=87 /DNA_ID=CAMNT_0044404789 /DNA_START=119 /DNA_END=378 /DNA_ORIENTATION=+